MRQLVIASVSGLADLIFPPLCEHCLNRVADRAPLCWKCMRSLECASDRDTAEIVDSFLVDADGIRLHCLWHFDRQGPLRDVIHALKYKNRPWYGRFLGRALAETIGPKCGASVVVPLPLHRMRLLERGYNQAEWIAEEAARLLGLQLEPRLISRSKPTETQTALKRRDARWQNVCDAFSVADPSKHEHRHVLLVDDVVTTGATVLSAATALRRAGVRTVTIATIGLARA